MKIFLENEKEQLIFEKMISDLDKETQRNVSVVRNNEYFSLTYWQTNDLDELEKASGFSEKEKLEFLQNIECKIQDYMILEGWEVIENQLVKKDDFI